MNYRITRDYKKGKKYCPQNVTGLLNREKDPM